MAERFVSYRFISYLSETTTRSSLKDELQESSRLAGEAYSTRLSRCDGLKFCRILRTFANCREADDWIAKNAKKGGPALAVRVSDGRWNVGGWCEE